MNGGSNNSINFARVVFLLVSLIGGTAIAVGTRGSSFTIPIWAGVLGGLFLGGGVIAVETIGNRFTLRGFTTATFGFMVGIFCAWLLNLLPVSELLDLLGETREESDTLLLVYRFITYTVLAFLGVTISIRSGQEDFAFIIPYIRFRQSNTSEQLLLLDASTVLDGRLMQLLSSGAIEGRMLIPQYILDKLKGYVDSSSSGKREKGERALSLLEELREHKTYKLSVHDNNEAPNEALDVRLAKTAKVTNAKLITTDDALTKTARLQGVTVMNIDEIADAFRPKVNVGDKVKLTITRPGKDEGQGVGYMADGSMIVVNKAAQFMGAVKSVIIISKLQTNTGLMVFAELEENV